MNEDIYIRGAPPSQFPFDSESSMLRVEAKIAFYIFAKSRIIAKMCNILQKFAKFSFRKFIFEKRIAEWTVFVKNFRTFSVLMVDAKIAFSIFAKSRIIAKMCNIWQKFAKFSFRKFVFEKRIAEWTVFVKNFRTFSVFAKICQFLPFLRNSCNYSRFHKNFVKKSIFSRMFAQMQIRKYHFNPIFAPW